MLLLSKLFKKRLTSQDSNRINVILVELSECRQDVRNVDNQQIQAAFVAATALGVIFGISNVDIIKVTEYQSSFFIASVLIFCAAFSYVITLGIVSVLRYHYIQHLEDQLSILIPKAPGEDEFMHWMSFSSPITTRNVKHLESKYSKIHYAYNVAIVLSLIIFCGYIIFIQYLRLDPKPQLFLVIIPVVFFILALIVFVISTRDSKKMFDFAMEKSQASKLSRINKETQIRSSIQAKESFKAIIYFIYPKTKDLQKMFLLAFGFLTGIFLSNDMLSFQLVLGQWKHFIILIVVFDILVYQARYQWNDIRGLREDMESPRKERLPAGYMGKKRSIIISFITMFGKIVMALLIAIFLGDDIRNPLLVCISLIVAFSILYEISRTKKSTIGVLAVVSLGYPLRLLSGIWAACPDIWEIGFPAVNSSICVIILLLFAYAFYGEMSVILPWTQEIIRNVFIKDKNGAYIEDNKIVVNMKVKKPHHHFLYLCIDKRNSERGKPRKNVYLLRENGEITDPWNWSYLISQSLLSALILATLLNKTLLITELITILFALITCKVSNKKIILLSIITIAATITKAFIIMYLYEYSSFYIFVCLNQFLFALTYFYLRYLFDPYFNFSEKCIELFGKFIQLFKVLFGFLFVLLIGKDTKEFLEE